MMNFSVLRDYASTAHRPADKTSPVPRTHTRQVTRLWRGALPGTLVARSLHWFLLRNGLLLASGALCMLRAMQSGYAVWWAGLGISVISTMLHALRMAPRERPSGMQTLRHASDRARKL